MLVDPFESKYHGRDFACIRGGEGTTEQRVRGMTDDRAEYLEGS